MVLLGSLRILLLDLSSGQITVISTLERVDKIRQQSFQVYLIINPPTAAASLSKIGLKNVIHRHLHSLLTTVVFTHSLQPLKDSLQRLFYSLQRLIYSLQWITIGLQARCDKLCRAAGILLDLFMIYSGSNYWIWPVNNGENPVFSV